MDKDERIIIQEIDILEHVPAVSKKNKRFQAILLQNTEELFAENGDKFINYLLRNPDLTTEEIIAKYKESRSSLYTFQRKLLLDWSNGYTRSILRLVFGTDFEGKLR